MNLELTIISIISRNFHGCQTSNAKIGYPRFFSPRSGLTSFRLCVSVWVRLPNEIFFGFISSRWLINFSREAAYTLVVSCLPGVDLGNWVDLFIGFLPLT
jgi:hypothetical protein